MSPDLRLKIRSITMTERALPFSSKDVKQATESSTIGGVLTVLYCCDRSSFLFAASFATCFLSANRKEILKYLTVWKSYKSLIYFLPPALLPVWYPERDYTIWNSSQGGQTDSPAKVTPVNSPVNKMRKMGIADFFITPPFLCLKIHLSSDLIQQ